MKIETVLLMLVGVVLFVPPISANENLFTDEHGKPWHFAAAVDCNKAEELAEYINYVLNDYHKSGYTEWTDEEGNNMLHEAAAFGCIENVRAILATYDGDYKNTYINETNAKGETPLDKARYFKHPEIEALLVSYGAVGKPDSPE